MKIIYIAGPFRASTAWGIAENVRAAERVGLEVARAGAMPLIPHANTAHFHGEGPQLGHDFSASSHCRHCLIGFGDIRKTEVCSMLSDRFWLEGTLELLRRCDAVLLVPGWEKSSGTRAEIEEAERLGIPVAEFICVVEDAGGPAALVRNGGAGFTRLLIDWAGSLKSRAVAA